MKRWGCYLPGLVHLGPWWQQQPHHSHMTLLGSEEERSSTVLQQTPGFRRAQNDSKNAHLHITEFWGCFVSERANIYFTKCLTQQSAEAWPAGFTFTSLTQAWKKLDGHGLTFSWSWTLAPFFSRVSTTLEWPCWEAAVSAVPPSCHTKEEEEEEGFHHNSLTEDTSTELLLLSLLTMTPSELCTVPLSWTQWRHQIQRGASQPHNDPAGRPKTGRWSLSGRDDKNRRCCVYFKSCTFFLVFLQKQMQPQGESLL